MSPLQQTLCFLLLFLISLSGAKVAPLGYPIKTFHIFPTEQKYRNGDLYARDPTPVCDRSGFDDDVPVCRALCGISSDPCSGGNFPSKRHEVPVPFSKVTSDYWSLHNVSENATNDPNKSHLNKRAFNVLTQGQIPAYLVQMLGDLTAGGTTPDPYFAAPTPLAIPQDTATVTVQRTFGNAAFQIGTPGLCGCTVVTIVSDRAVYMGHYFEDPSWTNANTFQRRVLNWISNTNPSEGQGDILDVSLFQGSNPRVYIMHPRRANSPNAYQSPNYRLKLPQLRDLLSGPNGLLPGAETILWLYNAVDHTVPADVNLLRTTQTGRALFQFDPTGTQAGEPSWRLFYEQNVFSRSDVPYPADAANGIPNQ